MPYDRIPIKPSGLNPFENDFDDIDDETFLNSGGGNSSSSSSNQKLHTLYEQQRAFKDRTLASTERSLSVLRESEQIGIATAEELARQREKLENTERQVNAINMQLRTSQKHINGIKSVFSSLKNYIPFASNTNSSSNGTKRTPSEPVINVPIKEGLDKYESHPVTRLRTTGTGSTKSNQSNDDFNTRLEANLDEMCVDLSRLKRLASDFSVEITSQNGLIDNIIDGSERADMQLTRQQREMNRLLK